MNIIDFIKENEGLEITKHEESEKSIIYFICEEDESIIYIGTTMNPIFRFKEHSAKIEFNHKPIYFFLHPKEDCIRLEKELIYKIKPKHNMQNIFTKEECLNKYKEQRLYYKNQQTIQMLKIKEIIICTMKQKNITQVDLAKKLQVSKQRIFQILTDKKNLNEITIKKIGSALGIKRQLLKILKYA